MIDSHGLTSAAALTVLRSAWRGAARATLRAGAPVVGLAFAAEGVLTAWKFNKGEIDGTEAIRRTKSSAVTNAGGLGAAAVGAAVGTMIFPGTGTMVGSVLGGMIGGKLASQLFKKPETKAAAAAGATAI
ncbi:MAG: hypothetical protein QM723_14495 [Myxococcaceae bacterium]